MKIKIVNVLVLVFAGILSIGVISCKEGNSIPKNSEKEAVSENSDVNEDTDAEIGKVMKLTGADFKAKIFDYSSTQEWSFAGTHPCVVDFYADWCGPCKQVAPVMDELAGELKGKVVFYKVDVDVEQELAAAFGISSIPSILFCPGDGSQPTMATGAMAKEKYLEAINELLLNK